METPRRQLLVRTEAVEDDMVMISVSDTGHGISAEMGAQLFTRIEGDQFVVRGLPLLAVLGWLREAGELAI